MKARLAPGRGGAGKKSAQIKKHKGNGSGATEEAAEGEKAAVPM